MVMPVYCSINPATGQVTGDPDVVQKVEGCLGSIYAAMQTRFAQMPPEPSEIRVFWETTHAKCSCCIVDGGQIRRVVVFDPQELQRVLVGQWGYLALKGAEDLKGELADVIAAVESGSGNDFSEHGVQSIKHAFCLMMTGEEGELQRRIWNVWVQAMSALTPDDTKSTFVDRTIRLGQHDSSVCRRLIEGWSHVGFSVVSIELSEVHNPVSAA